MPGGSKALFVCAHLPGPDAPQAGHKSAFAYLAELSATHDVDVLIACKASDLPIAKANRDALEAHASRIHVAPQSRAQRLLGVLTGMFCGFAPRLASRHTASTRKLYLSLLATNQYDTIWLEFSQTFWLASLTPNIRQRIVLSAHDIQTQLVASKSMLESILLLGWTFTSERRLLTRGSSIQVQSRKDADLLASLFRIPAQQIAVAKPALSKFVHTIRRLPDAIEAHSMLFWGAMGRPENSEAALNFIRVILPLVLKRFPEAKLYVVGSNPPPELSSRASRSIVVTGFIEDPSPYFERCAIGIAPLTTGAGIKVKVLEMLKAKIPIVSTPIGAEGIDADALLTITALELFDDAIARAWTV